MLHPIRMGREYQSLLRAPGEFMRAARERRGLSLDAVADLVRKRHPRVKVDGSYLSRIERGLCPAPWRTIVAVSLVLDADLGELLGHSEPDPLAEAVLAVDRAGAGYLRELQSRLDQDSFQRLLWDLVRTVRSARGD